MFVVGLLCAGIGKDVKPQTGKLVSPYLGSQSIEKQLGEDSMQLHTAGPRNSESCGRKQPAATHR